MTFASRVLPIRLSHRPQMKEPILTDGFFWFWAIQESNL